MAWIGAYYEAARGSTVLPYIRPRRCDVPQVPWSTLDGDRAEALIANLLYSEHPKKATRIRPSRGDYGIDVAVPNAAEPDKIDVYQIKKFYETLTANQRGQVEKSFRRFLLGFVRGGWPIADWYLMMPVDPTSEKDSEWFAKMPNATIATMFKDAELKLTEDEKEHITSWRNAPGRVIKWEGRNTCDNLAAKYPYVVDYFVFDGRERLRGAVAQLGAIIHRDLSLPDASQDSSAALLTPSEVQVHLQRLQSVLDTDPHYRYAWGFSPTLPEINQEEDLVAATQLTQSDGSTLTFKIYQRFPESLSERPIPIKLKFAVGDATFDREAFEMWRKYGKPLTAPAEVEADLPGGLGDAMSGTVAQVTLHPSGHRYEARFRIRKPDNTFGVTLSFSITVSTGSDGTGTWEHGTDHTGFLEIEIASDMEAHTGSWNFARKSIVGAEVVAALPSVEFLQDLHSPNMLQVAQKYGQFGDYASIPSHEPMFPDTLLDYLRSLAILQTRTPTPILIPDLTTVSVDDVQMVIEAAALIKGQTVIGREWGSARFKSDATPTVGQAGLAAKQIDLANHYQIKIFDPLTVNVGDQKLILGTVETLLLSAKYEVDEDGGIVALPFLTDTTYRTFAPDSPVPDKNHRPVKAKLLGALSDAIDSLGSVDTDHDAG
jgi:hypothetical protein